MIALVLVFCHFTEPIECRIIRVTPEAPTLIGCAAEAQERAVAWLNDNPDWEAVRWVCEQNVRRQKST